MNKSNTPKSAGYNKGGKAKKPKHQKDYELKNKKSKDTWKVQNESAKEMKKDPEQVKWHKEYKEGKRPMYKGELSHQLEKRDATPQGPGFNQGGNTTHASHLHEKAEMYKKGKK